ncbi:ribonuclease H [Sesbania bispinosa]|nr:ribonuclease H [Sesbania bispinosa]
MSGRGFKFLSTWLSHPSFRDQVIRVWTQENDWSTNFKNLTNGISIWNKEVFGNIFATKKWILNRLQGVQNKLMEERNPFLVDLQESLWRDYDHILANEEAYRFHQFRVNWLQLGDTNMRFFHQSTMAKKVINRIEALKDSNGDWVYDEDEVESLMSSFIRTPYMETSNDCME